ncbi:hypothetical protein LCGC14_1418880 [marine sediment metagenome]|uniref:Uncharacterized protein n=1 Tax=marine sediment metagenome TaxID=412755 RepID=A0A0F9JSD1_9ZZZZ
MTLSEIRKTATTSKRDTDKELGAMFEEMDEAGATNEYFNAIEKVWNTLVKADLDKSAAIQILNHLAYVIAGTGYR